MDNRKAIDILNDVIRELHGKAAREGDDSLYELSESLDEVRQFLGMNL